MGCPVIEGSEFTVSVAAEVFADPQVSENTARYLLPFCDAFAVNVNVVFVSPERLLKFVPPSVLTCHCTVGVGVLVAAAVKLTLLQAQPV